MAHRTLTALLALLRPLHWVKNLVVFAPLLFAGLLIDPPSLQLCAETFGVFCLAASGVYALNDIRDRSADAAHPVKRHRPLARGALPVWVAGLVALVLVVAALLWSRDISARTPPLYDHGLGVMGVADWVLAYLVLNAAYNLGLKRLAFLDVGALAIGFALRAFAGAAALQLQPSRWLVICVFGLALFLAVGKRLLELRALGADAARSRPMAWPYPPGWLPRLLTLLALADMAAYAWYTLSAETVAKIGSRALLITLPMVIFCVVRLHGLLLGVLPAGHRGGPAGTAAARRDPARGDAARGDAARGDPARGVAGSGDPVELVLRDRPCLVAVLLWLGACLAVVYRPW